MIDLHRTRPTSQRSSTGWAALAVTASALWTAGCMNSWKNGFIDPTQVGRFTAATSRNEIRRTLGPLEEPEGIPGAVEPTRDDLVVSFAELPIGRGDIMDVSIFELLQAGLSADVRRQVNEIGYITLPVLGTMKVTGMTARELELKIIEELVSRQILQNPEVSVTIGLSQAKRFSVVGNTNRPGEYPLPRPDYRMIEVIGLVGPLSPTQKNIYIMRGGLPAGVVPEHAEDVYKRPPAGEAAPAIEDPFAPQPDNGMSALSDVSSGRAGRAVGHGLLASADGAPSSSDFLDVLDSPRSTSSDMSAAGSKPSGQSKWIYLNGQWVEVQESGGKPMAPATSAPGSAPGTAPRDGKINWEAVGDAESPARVLEIPVQQLLKGDMRYNVVIRPNDVVNIPVAKAGEYYVAGHVARPGAYALNGRDITLKQAVAAAGGLSLLAWPTNCELVRRVAGDQEEIRSVNLDKIFSGEEPDVYLLPDDILNVGTNPVAPFLATIRNSFRVSYGFGFVYDRNFADEDTFFAQEQLRARKRAERLQRGFPP